MLYCFVFAFEGDTHSTFPFAFCGLKKLTFGRLSPRIQCFSGKFSRSTLCSDA